MFNQAIAIGRLGKDPEVTTVGSGQTVCKMVVATSDQWVDKNGHKKESTEWHNVVVWGKRAETCGQYLSKGSLVACIGKTTTRSWEGQDGQKRYATDLVAQIVKFLDKKEGITRTADEPNFGPEPSFDSNEEIPF